MNEKPHNLTFLAQKEGDPTAFRAYQVRGGEKRQEVRGDRRDPDWLHMDVPEFIKWLEEQGL